MKVKLDAGAIAPTKAHETDAGFDLYSREDKVIHGKSNACFDTGVHMELPEGTCGVLMSKSGLNVKYDILSTGLIDEGYTGSIVVKLYNEGIRPYTVRKGDKISQLVLMPYVKTPIEIVDSLSSTDRGDAGFGSSGK